MQIRLSDDEHAGLERLVASRAEELRGEGVDVTAASVFRWLLARELGSRGLDKPTQAETPKPSAKGAAKKSAKR